MGESDELVVLYAVIGHLAAVSLVRIGHHHYLVRSGILELFLAEDYLIATVFEVLLAVFALSFGSFELQEARASYELESGRGNLGGDVKVVAAAPDVSVESGRSGVIKGNGREDAHLIAVVVLKDLRHALYGITFGVHSEHAVVRLMSACDGGSRCRRVGYDAARRVGGAHSEHREGGKAKLLSAQLALQMGEI